MVTSPSGVISPFRVSPALTPKCTSTLMTRPIGSPDSSRLSFAKPASSKARIIRTVKLTQIRCFFLELLAASPVEVVTDKKGDDQTQQSTHQYFHLGFSSQECSRVLGADSSAITGPWE